MNRRYGLGFLAKTMGVGIGIVTSSASFAATSCEDLANIDLPNTTITATTFYPNPPINEMALGKSDAFTVNVPFCKIEATLTPTPRSDIRIEVWLPEHESWNGKYLGAGNGGYGGSLDFAKFEMNRGINRGYAVAGTDQGTSGTGCPLCGEPERIVDFAHRAFHLTAVSAKALISAYYGNGPEYSYYNGCSDGGHMGLSEAQRYPEDYDGIIIGAPAFNRVGVETAFVWQYSAANLDPAGALSQASLNLLTSAATAACDADDGIVDGVIGDPDSCDFNPASLQCSDSESVDCLTDAQISAVQKIYEGPRTSGGDVVYPGHIRGTEYEWRVGPFPSGPPLSESYRWVFGSDWDWREFDVDQDPQTIDRELGSVINADNPDLSSFANRGGKAILYHGVNDPLISYKNTVAYFETVVATFGSPVIAHDSARLFLVPGMGHCRGGPGANSFGQPFTGPSTAPIFTVEPPPTENAIHDVLTALEEWVEQGTPPDSIVATKYNDNYDKSKGIAFSRRLCPYPSTGEWTGDGSSNDADNFVCVAK